MKLLDISFHTILPLLIGCLIYFFENTSPFIKGLANYIPDGLWSYSLVSFMLIVWKLQIPYTWVLGIILMFVLTEYLQFLNVIPGTGDIIDLLIYFCFGGLSYITLRNSFFR